MNLSNTWKDFFANRESNAEGNLKPIAYIDAWGADVAPATKLTLLATKPDMVLLIGDSGGTITCLHSFKNYGGTILAPSDKLICLIGGIAKSAPAVIVDETTLTERCQLNTPPNEDILGCVTTDELLNLPFPPISEEEQDITFEGGMSFLPPPWLLNAVLSTRSGDPFELILAAKEAASAFDANQTLQNAAYVSVTQLPLEKFVMWAWGVKRNRVLRTPYFFDPNDNDIDKHHSSRHQACISPLPIQPAGPAPIFHPGVPLQPPPAININHPEDAGNALLQQLAFTMTRQMEEAATHNQLVAKQLEHSLEKEDKKKDRVKKFHSSIKQLLCFAAASDAEVVPEEISESSKRFFNAETLTNAKQELTLQFANLGMQDVAFAPTLVTDLYEGKLKWSNGFSPNNFSPFMFHEAEPALAQPPKSRKLVLHLESAGGKSAEESKKSVNTPTTLHEMLQQIKFFQGACSIFFGPTSIAATSLNSLILLIDQNKHIFKTNEVDTEFMSKFVLAVDRRFQLWFDNCMTAPANNRTAVDDSTLDFGQLVKAVRYGTFEVKLPLTFSKEPEKPDQKSNGKNKQSENNPSNTNNDNNQGSKKKKQKNDPRIINENPPEQFKMKPGETWATTFANKNLTHRVAWEGDDIKMCPRWFIGGYCFDNCFHKSSHVKAEEVPTEKLAAFKTYFDLFRNG